MILYAFLCVFSTLAYQGFINDTESPNDESNFSSTENVSLKFSNTTESPFEEIPFSSAETTQLPSTSSTEMSCPENMELHMPSKGAPYWRCLCIRPFLPIPLNGTCCKPFRQGPCPHGDFIPQSFWHPPFGTEEPQCVRNPCLQDGLVPANGTCIDITTRPICTWRFPLYNVMTSEVQCIRAQLRFRSAINAPWRRKCPLGSLPDKYGKCRKKL